MTAKSSLDRTLAALADEHRRLAVACLRRQPDGTATVDAIVDYVRRHASTANGVETVRIGLEHAGLPRLEEAGLVERRGDESVVRYRRRPEAESLLSSVGAFEATSRAPDS